MKVVIAGQGARDPALLHGQERQAVGEAPALVTSRFVKPESGVKTTSSGLERLQPVDLAEYVVDQVA